MFIGIGNSKGGTGKSTVLLLLASYLASKEKKKVFVIEIEEQGALRLFFERSQLLEHQLSFEYFNCSLSRMPLLLSRLSAEKQAYILIEFPSVTIDERLADLIGRMDMLICPFCYDSPTLKATVYFASLARRIKSPLALLFIPNRIITNGFYRLKEEADQVLRQIGPVSPCIAAHIGFQHISSMQLDPALTGRCGAVLELICSQYLPAKKDTY
jgi:chromosome partitioning protein